jgi:hypothetical protein
MDREELLQPRVTYPVEGPGKLVETRVSVTSGALSGSVGVEQWDLRFHVWR